MHDRLAGREQGAFTPNLSTAQAPHRTGRLRRALVKQVRELRVPWYLRYRLTPKTCKALKRYQGTLSDLRWHPPCVTCVELLRFVHLRLQPLQCQRSSLFRSKMSDCSCTVALRSSATASPKIIDGLLLECQHFFKSSKLTFILLGRFVAHMALPPLRNLARSVNQGITAQTTSEKYARRGKERMPLSHQANVMNTVCLPLKSCPWRWKGLL